MKNTQKGSGKKTSEKLTQKGLPLNYAANFFTISKENSVLILKLDLIL